MRLITTYTSKNTYDSKGRLTKVVVKDSYKEKKNSNTTGVVGGRSGTNYTTKYTYKQVDVPKSKVQAVREQQYALMNDESPKVTAWWLY